MSIPTLFVITYGGSGHPPPTDVGHAPPPSEGTSGPIQNSGAPAQLFLALATDHSTILRPTFTPDQSMSQPCLQCTSDPCHTMALNSTQTPPQSYPSQDSSPPQQPITEAWGMDLTIYPPTGILVGPGPTPPITWLVHILLWNSYFRGQVFAVQFPPPLAPYMLEISNSFDNATSNWPDHMNNLTIGLGEWTLTDAFYREQLATLPLMAITQLQAYNSALIHAITNNIDPSTVNIHGHSDATTNSVEWLGHQSPCFVDL